MCVRVCVWRNKVGHLKGRHGEHIVAPPLQIASLVSTSARGDFVSRAAAAGLEIGLESKRLTGRRRRCRRSPSRSVASVPAAPLARRGRPLQRRRAPPLQAGLQPRPAQSSKSPCAVSGASVNSHVARQARSRGVCSARQRRYVLPCARAEPEQAEVAKVAVHRRTATLRRTLPIPAESPP